jgi:ATP-dependent RNA helicase DDX21
LFSTTSANLEDLLGDIDETYSDVISSINRGPSISSIKSTLNLTPDVPTEGHDGSNKNIIANEKLVSKACLKVLKSKGIVEFTDIQRQALLPVFNGKDMIARSRTGTGKTIAFGLPMVERMVADIENGSFSLNRGRSPRMLVMAPTRELARQVEGEINALARPHFLSTTVFHGGAAYGPQESALRTGVDVLVATPGRLTDHLERGTLRLDNVRHVVLDEADEMLDMGFAKDIENILRRVNMDEAQTLLFSATTPTWIEQIARKYLKKPLRLDASSDGEARTATTVSHRAMKVPNNPTAKVSMLEDLVTCELQRSGSKAIIFTQTKREADELSNGPAFKTLSTGVLHGDLSQMQRDVTLRNFKSGKFRVLVATDVAARGIDIDGIDLVLQMSLPMNTDSYVHRAGRTGRAGKKGTSIILYSDNEQRQLRQLEAGVGNGFKFERHTAPSPSSVMAAAAVTAVSALQHVKPSVLEHFKEPAAKLLKEMPEEETHEELIAKCLALISGKNEVSSWSLQTGETGVTTVSLQAPRALKSNDVMFAVSKMAEYCNVNSRNIGKISICADPTLAVFDLPTEDAHSLVKFAQEQALKQFQFEITKELPELQPSFSPGGKGKGRLWWKRRWQLWSRRWKQLWRVLESVRKW